LNSLIEAETVDIQTRDLKAGMPSDDIADRLVPFTQAVLHRGELRKLTLPVREITECLQFSVLIEIAIVATLQIFDSAGC
jgi:hypothetical protein